MVRTRPAGTGEPGVIPKWAGASHAPPCTARTAADGHATEASGALPIDALTVSLAPFGRFPEASVTV